MAPNSIFVATRHAFLQDGPDQLEIRRHLVGGGAAEELVALSQLDLHHLGQRRVLLEDREVQEHEAPQAGLGLRHLGDLAPEVGDERRHLLAEERDEDLLLGLEVEVDRAAGDAGLARDVGHARAVVAVAREDADGGLDDLLGLLGISHCRGPFGPPPSD